MSRFKPKLSTVALLMFVGGLATIAATLAAAGPLETKLTIVNVGSHCDWSWVHTRAWHENRYADMIHEYLLLMRANPKFVWQLETVNEQLQPFLAKAARQWPGLIDEFWQRVREGRIEVVCGYSNPRLSEIYPELFVRNLVLGKEYFRRGVPTIRQPVLEVPDLMCGTSQVPQILKLADYRYFMFTRPVGQQAVFWRRGLDGTRILCCKDVYGYPELQGKPGAAFPGINALPVWRYAIGCDDMLPTPATLAEATAGDPQKRVLAGMLRFFQECEKYSDRISELSGPLDSCNYYTAAGLHGSTNIHTQHNQNEDLLLSLEKAQAMAAMLGRSFLCEPVDELWQDALSSSGHAIEWCWKEDYAERMAKGRHTRERARRFLEEALAAIASGIPLSSQRGSPLLVFNFHAWPTSGPVEFALDDGLEGLTLSDSNGHDVPLQLMAEDSEGGFRAAFIAADVPACGFKTFYLRREKNGGLQWDMAGNPAPQSSGEAPAIENEFYRVSLRSDGRLETFDKGRGAVLGAPQTGGFGDLAVYDMPSSGDTWLHVGPPGKRRDWRPAIDRCRTAQGPVLATLSVPGTIGGHAVTREVRLWHGSRRIEFGIGLNTTQPDNGIFCIRFPIGISGNVAAGIPFGVESRDHLAREPFRGESFCTGFPEGYDATRWTDVSSADFGYTFICPPGMHSGYAFKRGDRTIEFILDRFMPMPKDAFGRAAASIDGRGRHQWWCALLPHAGTWADAKSYRHALEEHVPLVAWSPGRGLGRGGASSLPEIDRPDRPGPDAPLPEGLRPHAAESLVEVSPANVVLSAMRLAQPAKPGDAPPLELRLYESAGKAADVVVRLYRPAASAVETNLLGEPIADAKRPQVVGHEVRFHLEPWKIVTLRLSERRPPEPNRRTTP